MAARKKAPAWQGSTKRSSMITSQAKLEHPQLKGDHLLHAFAALIRFARTGGDGCAKVDIGTFR
jgi:hypothetical protein